MNLSYTNLTGCCTLPNNEQTDEECDATKLKSSNTVGLTIKPIQLV